MKIGDSLSVTITVGEQDLAKAVGSGDVAVLATPRMIALMEEAASRLAKTGLSEGETTVGVAVSAEHTAATPLGMKVTATAVLSAAEGRRLMFDLTAEDECGVIGTGTQTRVIVEKQKFERRAAEKRNRNAEN